MATIVLLGTLDTKGNEYAFLRERISAVPGCEVLTVDCGIMGGESTAADIDAATVASAGGNSLASLSEAGDRGKAIEAMSKGARAILADLYDRGKLHGVLGLGGTGGTTLVTYAMQGLPVGVPKLMVSTVASGDTSPYVGALDITMMYSVVDISGINRISERILENAAAAIAAMATEFANPAPRTDDRLLIGATMFGVTTTCVTRARQRLEEEGYEVLVFHATGAGGKSMGALIDGGFLAGVLDVTTTELADELVGGVFSAGPNRLRAAGERGVPQVVSLGALDMVNFGAMSTVPGQFADRTLYVHNATTTLMRTTVEECALLGERIAERLNESLGPVQVFVPRGGVSAISKVGGPFHDPQADEALFHALLAGLNESIQVHDSPLDINDPEFADEMAMALASMIGKGTR